MFRIRKENIMIWYNRHGWSILKLSASHEASGYMDEGAKLGWLAAVSFAFQDQ